MSVLRKAPEQSEDREIALKILGSIDTSTPDELHATVIETTDPVYAALRDLVLRDPAENLETDPDQFLIINKLRASWLTKGWRVFFIAHETNPRPASVPVRPERPGEGEITYISVSIYPRDRMKLQEIRRRIEDVTGASHVTFSEICRMGLRALPSDNEEVLAESFRLVRLDDRRRGGARK